MITYWYFWLPLSPWTIIAPADNSANPFVCHASNRLWFINEMCALFWKMTACLCLCSMSPSSGQPPSLHCSTVHYVVACYWAISWARLSSMPTPSSIKWWASHHFSLSLYARSVRSSLTLGWTDCQGAGDGCSSVGRVLHRLVSLTCSVIARLLCQNKNVSL